MINDKDFENLVKDVRDIRDNHLYHFKEEIAELKVDTKWLKNGLRQMQSRVTGGLFATVSGLIGIIYLILQ